MTSDLSEVTKNYGAFLKMPHTDKCAFDCNRYETIRLLYVARQRLVWNTFGNVHVSSNKELEDCRDEAKDEASTQATGGGLAEEGVAKKSAANDATS
jgi:hypothetical protein